MFVLRLFHASDPSRQIDERALASGDLAIGRDPGPGPGWKIDDPDRAISRSHCVLRLRGAELTVCDTSSNGVTLESRNERLQRDKPVAIQAGETIRFGRFNLLIELADARANATAAPSRSASESSPFAPPPGLRLDDVRNVRPDPFASALPEDPLVFAGRRDAAPVSEFADDAWDRREERKAGDWNAPSPRREGHENLIGSDRLWAQPAPEPPPEIGFGFDAPFTRPMLRSVEVTQDDLAIPSDWDLSAEAGPAAQPERRPAAPSTHRQAPSANLEARAPPTAPISAFVHQPPTPPAFVQPPPPPFAPPEFAPTQFAPPQFASGDSATTRFAPPAAAPAPPFQAPPFQQPQFQQPPAHQPPFQQPQLQQPPAHQPQLQQPQFQQPSFQQPSFQQPAFQQPPAMAPTSMAPAPTVSAQPAALPPPPAGPGAHDAMLLEAFCAGAKLDPSAFAGEDVAAVMKRLGGVYQQMVLGLADLISERTNLKNEYRMVRTTVRAEGNNPFKWAPPQRLAVDLIKAHDDGFLSGPAAVADSFQDLKKHLLCMLAGLRAALSSTLDSLAPEKVDEQLKGQSFVMKNRGAAAWADYVKLYRDFRKQADDNPDSLINREFRAAYEKQLQVLDGMGPR